MRDAVPLFVAAADSYDDIARRAGPLVQAERREADTALRAAIARANQSRQQGERAGANTNLPNDWRNAETRHSNAEGARRETAAEMRAATNLYTQAADAFDDVNRRNTALIAENQNAAQAARSRAEAERQTALAVQANVRVAQEFNSADAVFRQAGGSFSAHNYSIAQTQFDESAAAFAAAAMESRRREAAELVDEAQRRAEESVALAIHTGQEMEEISEVSEMEIQF
jgi:hypothetical protein